MKKFFLLLVISMYIVSLGLVGVTPQHAMAQTPVENPPPPLMPPDPVTDIDKSGDVLVSPNPPAPDSPLMPPDPVPDMGENGDELVSPDPVAPKEDDLVRPPNAQIMLSTVGGTWTAQGPGPAYNGQVEGSSISNGEVSGAVHTVVAHPTDPNTLYAGAANGGIWKTTNATAASPTWTPLTDNESSLSIGALELDPTDGTYNTLVAGIGLYSSMAQRGGARTGLLRTTDGGTSWTPITNLSSAPNVSGVAPRGNTIVASVNFATPYSCSNIGVFHSADTGTSWTRTLTGVVYDLASDPNSSTTLYAGLIYGDSCGGSNGIFKSTNTGATWTKISSGAVDSYLISNTVVNNNIEIAAHGNDVFVNIVHNGQSAAIYHYDNTLTAWTQMDLPLIPATTATPLTITGATNAAPIVITTSAAHGFSTGDRVDVSGVLGNTAANGIWDITVMSATQFSLDNSTGNGAYTSGGTVERVVGMNPRFKPGGQGGIHASIRVDPTTTTRVYAGGDRQDAPLPNYLGAANYTGSLWRGDATVAAGNTAPSPQWDHLTHSNAIVTIPNGGTASSSAPHADLREMVFDANGNIVEGDDGGIYRRTNPANNTGDWVSVNGNIQVTEMHDVTYDTLSNRIISGNQDTGTTYQTSTGGTTWYSLSTGDGGDVAVDNITLAGSNLSIRYTSFQYLGYFRRTIWDASGGVC